MERQFEIAKSFGKLRFYAQVWLLSRFTPHAASSVMYFTESI